MEAYLTSRKRRRDSIPSKPEAVPYTGDGNEESTEVKLAILASLHPSSEPDSLLEILLEADGSVEKASVALSNPTSEARAKGVGYQSSLSAFTRTAPSSLNSQASKKQKTLTKKGQTLHVYSPEDIAANSPCSIIHNFLDPADADALLTELLAEASSFQRASFKLFDNVVESPHTASFFVDSLDKMNREMTEYLYNGYRLTDVREITPHMRRVSALVKEAVNNEIAKRIKSHYPGGRKLRYQSPKEWLPNAAFVNCYAGGAQNVGYHSDQLTYLGPRAIIGSLSLGVSREFRVRKVVPREDGDNTTKDDSRADAEGQIAIHLPHNSLLVMHAEMQEEWKHSIAPAKSIDPHPIAGNKRINVTYRHYREPFHPKNTPKCKCGIPTVLRAVQRRKENWGRYFWMCHAGLVPDKGVEGCSFFQWADFDDDGEPIYAKKG